SDTSWHSYDEPAHEPPFSFIHHPAEEVSANSVVEDSPFEGLDQSPRETTSLVQQGPQLSFSLTHPFLWFDFVFTDLAGSFGRPGRWLLRPRGRALLGGIGLVFLGLALALLALDQIGWTW